MKTSGNRSEGKSLRKKEEELQRFREVTAGLELRMIGLKKEENDLLRRSYHKEKYRIAG